MSLLEISLGIAGTAKNTGKTTTTNEILSILRYRGIRVYLTSIGYDGEDLDNVTGLPKPKISVQPGDFVATAKRCLLAGTAAHELVLDTDIHTPLGRIQLIRITKPGLVVIAGPNKSSEVRQVSRLFRALGPGVTLFDGALSRIAPLMETDGLILATGAAFSTDIPLLANETKCIEQILQLPCLSGSSQFVLSSVPEISIFDRDNQPGPRFPFASLLSLDHVNDLIQNLETGSTLLIPGIIGEAAMTRLASCWGQQLHSGQLILSDPIKLLVAGKASRFCKLLQELQDSGIHVGVLKRLPLIAVTINPFYPAFRMESQTYQPAYVDFHRLQVAIRNSVASPVYNVVHQGADKLVDTIIHCARPWRHPDSNIDLSPS